MPYKDKQKAKEWSKKYHQKPEVKVRMKEYRQRPEYKARMKEYIKRYLQENKDYFREYHEIHKEELKKKRKKYHQRPEVKTRRKEYQQRSEVKAKAKEYNQKPEIKAKKKEYSQKHQKEYNQKPEVKVRVKKYSKEYEQRAEVKKRRKEYNKEYFKNHREQTNKRLKKKWRINKNFNIRMRLGNLLRCALNRYTKTGKYQTSKKYGINYKAIIEQLKPFPEDISLYHVDHIRPLCSFNLEDSEEIRKAFAPENHQWLLASENMSKGGRY